MGRVFSGIVIVFCCTILFVTAVLAKPVKEVYLQDGGVIECQNVWLTEGKVKVLVNRDTLLDLSKDDVDMQKTFAKRLKRVKGRPVATKKITHPRQNIAAGHPATAKNAPMKSAPDAMAKLPEVKPSHVVPTAPTEPAPAAGTPSPAASVPAVPQAPVAVVADAQSDHSALLKPSESPDPGAVAKPAPAAIIASALTQEQLLGNGLYLLLLMLIMIVSMCKVFAKAGQAWWKALIPIYSLFVFVSIAGKQWWWVILLMIPLVNFIVFFLIHISLARRFGQGALFGFGLALVGFIFFPLLAFGKSEYQYGN